MDHRFDVYQPLHYMQDEVTSFPLYVEALKFAFHEDRMIRVAIRTLTLNVYHGKLVNLLFAFCSIINGGLVFYFCCSLDNLLFSVGDESVNRFVSRVPLSDYFSDMVQHFKKQCIDLDKLVVRSSR